MVRRSRPAGVPDLLTNIGNLFMDKNPELAIESFRAAEKAYRKLRNVVRVQRSRHSQAVALRRLGQPLRAWKMLRRIRANYGRWGLTVKAAESDFNIAVALRDLGHPAALDTALQSFAVLDRHRHELATAEDRSGSSKITYPWLIELVLELAIKGDEFDLVAAIAERARTQTVTSSSGEGLEEQLAPPPPVRARTQSLLIEGNGEGVTLHEVAAGIAGEGSVWLSWVRYRDTLLRIVVTADSTEVSSVPFPTELLRDLHDACASSTSSGRDSTSAVGVDRPALFRIASGPLLADPRLADVLRKSMPPSLAVPWAGRSESSGGDLLGQLAKVLIPLSAWNAESVVLAPPTFLGQVPWAALRRDRAWIASSRIAICPPVAALHRPSSPADGTGGKAWIADSLGDLRYCRASTVGWDVATGPEATTQRVVEMLSKADIAVVRGHVRPGSATQPSLTALRLADQDLTSVALRHHLAGATPRKWLILGCDAAGAGTGDEWAGLPIGLAQAGADELIVTEWPIVDSPEQESLDLALVALVEVHGLWQGLTLWQRENTLRWEDTNDPAWAPHRWAGHVFVATATDIS
jgi:hypothetical protein